AELVVAAGTFGMVRSGWGELLAWRRSVFVDVLAAVAATAERMARSLAAADALVAENAALPRTASDEGQFRLLQPAERLLTTKPTSPRPASPAQLLNAVRDARRRFNSRLQGLQAVAGTSRDTLAELLSTVAALLPLTDFDATGLVLTPFRDRVVAFAGELRGRAEALRADVASRLAAADAALAAYDQAVTGPDRVHAGLDTLKALLGDDVLAVPEFTVTDALATELRNARNASDGLVKHLTDSFGRDFPVDDWLHGVARVRETPRLWERVALL